MRTPNNRHPNPNQQNNTANIPFYRDTHNYNNNNRNFRGGNSSGSPYYNQRRGGFHENRRFNNSNNYTPRNNRIQFQRGRVGPQSQVDESLFIMPAVDIKLQDNVDISQFYHPSILEDPWKDLIDDSCSASDQRQSSPAKNINDDEHKNQLI